jgi:DNA-binding GntR family transcriptional regulator
MLLETDRVYGQLVKMIITLELEPGSTVTQAQLADLLNCGRTPLREAIQRLMTTGLLLHTPNRGISIAPLDIRHYAQAEEAYRCVHSEAVRLAALRRTDQQLSQLREILATADRLASDVLARGKPFGGDAYTAIMAPLDVEFHSLLAEASQNKYLAEAAARLELVIIRYGSVYYGNSSLHAEVWGYHDKILSAVSDRDPDEAERLLLAHMALAKRQILASSGYVGPVNGQ